LACMLEEKEKIMKKEIREGKALVSLEGELTVARAAVVKDSLVRAINSADSIVINLDKVSGMDLSCLQLLCSAHRTAARRGKVLAIKDQSLPLLLEARRNAGFIYSKQCRYVSTDDCFWVGGAE